MSGGGSSGTTWQQSQSESGPPAFLQPYLQNGINDLVNYYNAHPNAPAYYSGETVAPLSTPSLAAIDKASALAGDNPTLSAANGTLARFLNGGSVDPRANPDYQTALAASFQPALDAFNSQVLPGINASYSAAGRYGSGARAGAIDRASALAGNNPTLAAANGSLARFLNGGYVDPRANPDYQAALAASFQPAIDAFNSQVLPGINSSYSAAGRYGSGARAGAIDRATRTLDNSLANAAATAGANYYSHALDRQLQAAQLAPGLNTANWQDVSGLAAAGRTVDRQRQAQDAAAQAAYNYNANAQMNYIAQYLAMLNAGYPGGTNRGSGFSNSSATRSASPFDQALGGIGALTGILGLL